MRDMGRRKSYKCPYAPFPPLIDPPPFYFNYLFPSCTDYSLFHFYSPSRQLRRLRGKILEKVRPNSIPKRVVALKLALQRLSSNSSSGTGTRFPTSAKTSSVQLVSMPILFPTPKLTRSLLNLLNRIWFRPSEPRK